MEDKNVNWDLSKIYPSWKKFDLDLNFVRKNISNFLKFKGKLKQKNFFISYIKFSKKIDIKIEKLYYFSHLKNDVNLDDKISQKKFNEVNVLLNELNVKTSFFLPEILKCDKKKIIFFLKEEKLEEFIFGFEKIFREKKHILDERSEKLLSNFSGQSHIFDSMHNSLRILDEKDFFEIELSSGKKVKIDTSNFRDVLENTKKRIDREKIFKTFFSQFEKKKNSYCDLYKMIVNKRNTLCKIRGYKNILNYSLFSQNISEKVYLNLLDETKKYSSILKKFYKFKFDFLKIKNFKEWDLQIHFSKNEKKYNFEKSKSLCLNTLKKLGLDYYEKCLNAFSKGQIDWLKKNKKREGGYCSSNYDFFPYILMNSSNTLSDCFTLIHEVGHSIHSIYSCENQKRELSNHTIFIAEIASTLNEQLLIDYLLENVKNKKERIYILEKAINEIISTFFRQATFAKIELDLHNKYFEKKDFSINELNEICLNAFSKLHGLYFSKNSFMKYYWAVVPHFYEYKLYVYKYATSFGAMIKIYSNLKKSNFSKKQVDKYLSLLKMGGNDFPTNQLKKIGINHLEKDFYKPVIERFNYFFKLLKKELK